MSEALGVHFMLVGETGLKKEGNIKEINCTSHLNEEKRTPHFYTRNAQTI